LQRPPCDEEKGGSSNFPAGGKIQLRCNGLPATKRREAKAASETEGPALDGLALFSFSINLNRNKGPSSLSPKSLEISRNVTSFRKRLDKIEKVWYNIGENEGTLRKQDRPRQRAASGAPPAKPQARLREDTYQGSVTRRWLTGKPQSPSPFFSQTQDRPKYAKGGKK